MRLNDIASKLYEQTRGIFKSGAKSGYDSVDKVKPQTRIKANMFCTALAGVLLYATATMASIISIREDDNVPVIQECPMDLLWDYTVQNNSNLESEDSPAYNTEIREIKFYNLFSEDPPILLTAPYGWRIQGLVGDNRYWNFSLINPITEYIIPPSGSIYFQLITDIPPDSQVQVGTLYGQGMFNVGPLNRPFPELPGEDFQGPVGVVPEPMTMSLLGLGALALLRKPRREDRKYVESKVIE